MNEDMKLIIDSRKLVKSACLQLNNTYNDMCGDNIGAAVLTVFDSELRTAVQIQKLEQFFTNGEEEPLANEYELNKYINSEK